MSIIEKFWGEWGGLVLSSLGGLRWHLQKMPRGYKRLIQVVVNICLIWAALWLAFIVSTEGGGDLLGKHLWLFAIAPLISIPLFVRFGMYRAVMRYLGGDALIAIVKAASLAALLVALASYFYIDALVIMRRSIFFSYWWLSIVLVGGLRLLLRHYFMGGWFSNGKLAKEDSPGSRLKRVAIYGAGTAGNQLAAALRVGRSMRPVAFVDDDPHISNRIIAGMRVYKPKHIQQMINDTGATELLLALPSVPRIRRREILLALEKYALHVRTVPGVMDLASGRVKVEDVQEVDIADLLGRDVVEPDRVLFERRICNRVLMVTGAGGSIGSELCRQIIAAKPKVLLLFDHCEFSLYTVHSELEQRVRNEGLNVSLVPIIGSVRDQKRQYDLMCAWGVNTVYHAAAYKHVPLVEHNVAEGVLNNLMGTLYSAQAALLARVDHFVLVSTDKAVRPTSVMGSTKRLAEMVLQALSLESEPVLYNDNTNVQCVNNTRFKVVRFGNVLGSSGSVIPRFYQQILKGGPVTVTHPNITRYFMTIPEAAQFVIQASSMGRGVMFSCLTWARQLRFLNWQRR